MKLIQAILTPLDSETSDKRPFSIPRFPIGKTKELDASILKLFQQFLNDDFFLIKNCSVIDFEKEVPPLLIGPMGVMLIFENNSHGIFRANEMNWERLNESHNQYQAETPNPLVVGAEQSKKVTDYLALHGFTNIPVQPVILFTHPAIHLELLHPAIRLVPMDGLGRFITSIAQAAPEINLNEIPALVHLLAPFTTEDETLKELRDGFSFIEEKPKKQVKLPEVNIPLPNDDQFVKTVNKVPFTTRQLIILGGLVIINLIILILLVLVILGYRF